MAAEHFEMVLTELGYDQHPAARILAPPAEAPKTAKGSTVATTRSRNCTGHEAFLTRVSEGPFE